MCNRATHAFAQFGGRDAAGSLFIIPTHYTSTTEMRRQAKLKTRQAMKFDDVVLYQSKAVKEK